MAGQDERFILHQFEDQSYSLWDKELGQAMHSSIGAWNEAWQLYAEPAGLHLPGPEVVVFDVGLGCAANAFAAIEACRRSKRQLTLVSFEKFLEAPWAALEAPLQTFSFLSSDQNRADLKSLLTAGRVPSPGLDWQLVRGDFLSLDENTLNQVPKADIIFYDFFSPKACPELWTKEAFLQIRTLSGPHALLLTYSSARVVREALGAAGFCVEEGPSTARKRNTTRATLS